MSIKYKPLHPREFLFTNPYRNFMPNQLRQKDYDRDGVPNNKDCRPLNHWRQHLSKRRKEEIDKLKIRVAYLDENRIYRQVPLSSSKAKQKAPHAVEQVYSTLNRHPQLIRELKEMTDKDWIETNSVLLYGKHRGYTHENIARVNFLGTSKPDGGRMTSNISAFDKKWIGKKETLQYASKPQDVLAETIFHERQHEKQSANDIDATLHYNEYEVKSGLLDLEKKLGKKERKGLLTKEEKKELYDLYRNNPAEIDANEVTQKQLEKRLKFPPEEEVYEGFRETIGD